MGKCCAEKELCLFRPTNRLKKTNPISAGPRDPCIPLFHHSNIPAKNVLCKTKPISRARGKAEEVGRPAHKQSQSAGAIAPNKANWPRTDWKRRWAGAGNADHDGANVRNEADFPGAGSVVPAGSAGLRRVKQSQSSRSTTRCKCSTKMELWQICPANRLKKTKPISGAQPTWGSGIRHRTPDTPRTFEQETNC